MVIQCNRCVEGVQVEYDQHYRTGRIESMVIDAQLRQVWHYHNNVILMVAYGVLAQ